MPIKDRDITKNIFTPQEVRTILDADNKEIAGLCKKASITPRKNLKGQTYFSKDEVAKLKRLKSNLTATERVKSMTTATPAPIEPIMPTMTTVTTPTPVNVMNTIDADTVVNNLLSKLQNIEENISEKLSTVIDEKLDGMDEVVVELIRCKTDNETLRQKVNELNKQNYQLKTELTSYKSIGLGLYIKSKTDDLTI